MKFEAVLFDTPVRLLHGSSSSTAVDARQLKAGVSIVSGVEEDGSRYVTLDGVAGAWRVPWHRVGNYKVQEVAPVKKATRKAEAED
jgi:hypothetical protein